MKHKNLEKAVLLTVMLMSLHGVTSAADIDSSMNAVKTGTVKLENGKIYVIQNIEQYSVNSFKAENGDDITINVGDTVDDSATLAQKRQNITMFKAAGEGSTITINGGNLTLTTNYNSGEYQGGESAFNITGGAAVVLNNKSTTIGSKADGDVFREGLRITTNDDITTKSSFTANGDLNIYATIKQFNSFADYEGTAIGNSKYPNGTYNASAGIMIGSSDVTVKGSTNIEMFNENASEGDNVGLELAHKTVDKSANGITDSRASTVNFGDDANDVTTITASQGSRVYGVYIQKNYKNPDEVDSLTFTGTTTITAKDASTKNYGIRNRGGNLTSNGNMNVISTGSSKYGVTKVVGLELEEGTNTFNGILDITASGAKKTVSSGTTVIGESIGINALNTNVQGQSLNIKTSSIGEAVNFGIKAENGTISFTDNVNIASDNVISATANANVDMQGGFTGSASSSDKNAVMSADGASIKINSGKAGAVNYTGTTSVANNGTIEMNLTEDGSVWNLTGDSTLTNLESRLNTVIDMTKDKGAFSTLTVDKLTADGNNDGGVIKMNIDGDAANTADRLFITGEHNGKHYISIDDTVTDTAVGTVLVSVGTENGSFAAEQTEGALYWTDYDLEEKDSNEAGYTKDWVISKVEQSESGGEEGGNTTSVDTILGANALNYHTWRAENEQLMRRMGELRNNGADEEGAWFRVHGSKINRDDSMSF